MKKNLIFLLMMMLSITSFSQFTAPENLEFNYEYIMIDQSGECAGQWLYGPTYCSHFIWNSPDTNSRYATFEYYNLYYYAYYEPDTNIIASLTDTVFDIELGVLGEVWVTAVYSNPYGESDPSNIIINTDLPISVEENNPLENIIIQYDRSTQSINIRNCNKISKVNIINNQGKIFKSTNSFINKINIADLSSGLYIVEIFYDESKVIRKKILK